MEHREMVALIRGGVAGPGGVWADLGAGTGNFTWALAELLGSEAAIHALDRDARAIAAQQARLRDEPPSATVLPRQADVLQPLDLPPLDGVLAANLLHFVRDQAGLLRRIRAALHPDGRLLVVEYEQALPLPWVPHPLPFARLAALVAEAGFQQLVQVGTRRSPSSGRTMYAACVTLMARDMLVQEGAEKGYSAPNIHRRVGCCAYNPMSIELYRCRSLR